MLRERGDVLVGDDAAADHQDVVGAPLGEQLEDARKHRHVRAGQDADADDVDVLLDRGVDDLLRRAVETRIDDVHAGVAQAPRHDLDAAIVAVETHLGNEHANGLIARIHLGPRRVARPEGTGTGDARFEFNRTARGAPDRREIRPIQSKRGSGSIQLRCRLSGQCP